MRIAVKLFASAREKAGIDRLDLELAEGADIRAAGEQLLARVPALRGQLDRVAYAVNLAYASPQAKLRDGDELAIIPPVSGG